MTVPLGTTINWTNTGAVTHTVTVDDGASFDSGSLDPQSGFSFTATTAGTFTYHCSFHPWMTGTITVTP
jgi:plastocyanin